MTSKDAPAGIAVGGCVRPPEEPPPFTPRRVSRVYTQSLAATPDRILPLLTPIGEKAWASGWDPTVLFEAPPPGTGTVFVTRAAGQPDTLWVLERFDVEGRTVRYVHVTPGSDVTEIDIALHPMGRRTDAIVRYTYTGLSERGNALVDTMTEDYYLGFMRTWEQELNDHLATRP